MAHLDNQRESSSASVLAESPFSYSPSHTSNGTRMVEKHANYPHHNESNTVSNHTVPSNVALASNDPVVVNIGADVSSHRTEDTIAPQPQRPQVDFTQVSHLIDS